MGKYDKLFEMIVTSRELSSELGTDAKRYKTIAEGKKAMTNSKVRAIAEIISEVGSKYDVKKTNANILAGEVTLDDAEMNGIYRKIMSIITK